MVFGGWFAGTRRYVAIDPSMNSASYQSLLEDDARLSEVKLKWMVNK